MLFSEICDDVGVTTLQNDRKFQSPKNDETVTINIKFVLEVTDKLSFR